MATPLYSGLRTLRIPALRLCRQQPLIYSWRRALVRPLSTTLPRLTPAAQAVASPDASKQVSAAEVETDEPVPFSDLKGKVSPKTLDAITVRPFKHTHMTPVQEAVLGMLPALSDPLKKDEKGNFVDSECTRDLMVRAKTGTGKTLAFLVPAIESRVKAIDEAREEAVARAGKAADKRLEEIAKREFTNNHVGALILSPTRELAKQIAVEAEKLSAHHGFKVHQFLGGESKSRQMREWTRNRKDIVVATTGRLRDLMDSESGLLDGIRTAKLLILDEADTMLDMGFREDIEAIAQELPQAPERQTFVFSATISKAIQQIARRTLSKNHMFINTVSDEDSPVHAHVPQYHTVLSSAADQLPHTLRLIAHDQLTNPGKSKIILFLPTTKLTQLFSTLLRELTRSVLPAGRETTIYELHSKKSMESRTRTSDRFRNDKSGACVLITSDVSARGVDYPGVTRVIQLCIPASPDQYVHRVGRTGRTGGGSQGRGDLVLLPFEHSYVQGELNHVPLKPVTTNDLAKQVSEMAAQHDEDPKAFFPPALETKPKSAFERGRGRSGERERAPLTRYPGRVAPRLEALNEEIQQVLSLAEEEDIKETFASMLGFYVARCDELRAPRNAVLDGLRDWSTQGVGLEKPPYVSEAFLAKIGFAGERKYEQRSGGSRQRSSSFGLRKDRDRKDSDRRTNRWEGRGSNEARRRRTNDSGEYRDGRESRYSVRESRNEWPPRRNFDEGRKDARDGGDRGRRPSWDNVLKDD
ncbi:DEAD-domain-containing protein [Fomitiporia mediterranea MF3/22]|uniref:DEAD-domain-containing protein n=1 Tax=Fomitiporia mediterranea (strain MF3/22) TaxID=694068 RepID=UPI0004407C78|nr:DEAD-domain-containing protein [Fomitiporia mediterranea MF3/22]EJD05523.1 DEAD-domain-containing protein [Fomitiporia mediterranea MF3/22]